MRFSDKVKLSALKGRACGALSGQTFRVEGTERGGLIAGVIVKMPELLKNNLREVLAINDFNSHRER